MKVLLIAAAIAIVAASAAPAQVLTCTPEREVVIDRLTDRGALLVGWSTDPATGSKLMLFQSEETQTLLLEYGEFICLISSINR